MKRNGLEEFYINLKRNNINETILKEIEKEMRGEWKMEKVEQFYNKNQFLIKGENGITFQSYQSTIANISNGGKLTLFSNWDYSHTTLKHLYLFLKDYKNNIENFTYSQIFSKGFEYSKNKKQFIQNLIDKKIIKYAEG